MYYHWALGEPLASCMILRFKVGVFHLLWYTLVNKVVTHGNEVAFDDYSYSTCLWDLKAGWLAVYMFLYVQYVLFFHVYFGKIVTTFIDTEEV